MANRGNPCNGTDYSTPPQVAQDNQDNGCFDLSIDFTIVKTHAY